MNVYTVADGCCGTHAYNKTDQICCNSWNLGNGDSCCNLNGLEDAFSPPDEPYKKEKCCVKGRLYNYACLKNGASNYFFQKYNMIYLVFLSFILKYF